MFGRPMSSTDASSDGSSRRTALALAAAFALVGFVVAYTSMRKPGRPGDFLYWFTAADALRRGVDPYSVIPAADPARFQTGFYYPLPALLVTLPFVALPYALAGSLFVALSSGLLAYGVARDGAHRLFLFASAPFIIAARSGQWSIVLAAAAAIPALGFLAAVKPNLGVATFLYRPTRWLVAGSLALVALSFAVRPTWLGEWMAAVGGVQSRVVPILTPVGPLLLLAATRWRRREARLFLGLACVPQAPWFYDQLVLWLVPATAVESMTYTLVSQLALAAWIVFRTADPGQGAWWLAAALYLPPLVMVLRRPNAGALPPVVERLVKRISARWGARAPRR